MELSELADTFFEEASEHLDSIESILLGIDVESPDSESLSAIFRAAHSIKGGAGAFGFHALQSTTHIFENILDGLRNGRFILHDEVISLFLDTRDVLRSLLDIYRAGEQPGDDDTSAICERLQTFYDTKVKDEESSAPGIAQPLKAIELLFTDISSKDVDILIEELSSFGSITSKEKISDTSHKIIIESSDDPDSIEAVMYFVVNPEQLAIKVLEEARSMTAAAPSAEERKPDTTKAPVKKSAPSESTTLRVPVEKVDQIINLVGELVITQSMLDQSLSGIENGASDELISSMEVLRRNARELQDSVMSIRMVPMDYVFSRFPRQIRDIAKMLNKDVELVTEGKSTELDKSLVEKIIDPLSHLIRNSMDHGIESPDVREANNKSRTGTITLAAKHQGGHIIIEVKDDGAGLNREKLISKAKANGIEIADNISDDEVWQLIFHAGFSTAEEVTDVSGRGVGMDVVRRNINELGGSVQILSFKGQGTTTRITLPLTMAILDGMLVRSGGETYILPLVSVIESLQPEEKNVFSVPDNEKLLRVRDEYVPIINMYEALDIENATTDLTKSIAVIMRTDGRPYALIVDELVGQQQVVVKNLETNYRKVQGFSAATILGDGRVSFIIDITEVFKLSRENKKNNKVKINEPK